MLRQTLKLENYPKSTIRVVIDSMQSSSKPALAKTTALNATFFALNQSGIALKLNPYALCIFLKEQEFRFGPSDELISEGWTRIDLVVDAHDPSEILHLSSAGPGCDLSLLALDRVQERIKAECESHLGWMRERLV